jgi:4-hydroxyphenylpyruvate dioxygenase-like putative hemolysin
MACRTGCRTKDHASYAECCRDGAVRVTFQATPKNSWDKELNAYASARAQGIQPASTRTPDIERAVEASQVQGVAFNAGV